MTAGGASDTVHLFEGGIRGPLHPSNCRNLMRRIRPLIDTTHTTATRLVYDGAMTVECFPGMRTSTRRLGGALYESAFRFQDIEMRLTALARRTSPTVCISRHFSARGGESVHFNTECDGNYDCVQCSKSGCFLPSTDCRQ